MTLAVGLLPSLAIGQQTHLGRAPEKQAATQRGKELFSEYCASCHGLSGKGDGPAAASLKRPPANLTLLAAHNKGQFPSLRVMQAIKAGPSVPAHGSKIMPVWGPIFLRGDRADGGAQAPPQTPSGAVEESEYSSRHASTQSEVQLRIYNLVEYIKTLQER